jgi:aerobic-type carbon monoxide dehydrogenase small subunit (CoxS/CutS family)
LEVYHRSAPEKPAAPFWQYYSYRVLALRQIRPLAGTPTLVFDFAKAQTKFEHRACNRAWDAEDYMAEPIHTQINGKSRIFESEPETTLLFALREELGLTGTKYGCGEGQCGACTILLNGAPRRSCQLSVRDADGKSIHTIEGFEQNGQLHPVQQAFLDQGAFQCAYCTSGMIVSSVALLQKNLNPSEPEIVQALQGNICRCGTHPRIIAAVQQAAKAMHGAKS